MAGFWNRSARGENRTRRGRFQPNSLAGCRHLVQAQPSPYPVPLGDPGSWITLHTTIFKAWFCTNPGKPGPRGDPGRFPKQYTEVSYENQVFVCDFLINRVWLVRRLLGSRAAPAQGASGSCIQPQVTGGACAACNKGWGAAEACVAVCARAGFVRVLARPCISRA